MKCVKCGTDLADDALFCPNCGTKVEDLDSEATTDNNEESTIFTKSVDDDDEEEIISETSNSEEEIQEEAPVEKAEEQPKNNDAETMSGNYIFCPECGTKNDPDAMFCGKCGKRFGKQEFSAAKEVKKEKKAKKAKEKSGKAVKIIVGVVACAAVVCAGLFAAKTFLGGSKADAQPYTLTYVKDNEAFVARAGKYTPSPLTEKVYDDPDDATYSTMAFKSASYCGPQMTDDGKYTLYIKKISGTTGDLYIQKKGKPDKEEKLASSIKAFRVAGNYVVYRTDDSRLYFIDFKQNKEKITNNVNSFDVSKDGRYVLFTEYEDDETKLYVYDLKNTKDGKDKLAEASSVICYTDNFETIVYRKEDVLYVLKNFKVEEKVAKKVENVQAFEDGSNVKIYYSVLKDEEEISLYDFVIDDKAKEDANMELPQIKDYQTSSGLLKSDVVTDDQYYEDYEEYQRKTDRDRAREALKEEKSKINTFEISYYDTGSKAPVAVAEAKMLDGVASYLEVYSKDLACVYSINTDNLEMFSLEDIQNDYYSLESKINSKMLGAVDITLLQGQNGYTIDPEADELESAESDISFARNKDTNKVYMFVRGESTYNIYEVKAKGSAANFAQVAEDIDSYDFVEGSLITYSDTTSNGKYSDLYVDGKKVASDVYPSIVHVKPETAAEFFYIVDYDDGEGTLYYYDIKAGKSVKVTDDYFTYSGVYKVDDKNYAYIGDFSQKSETGELYVFTGKDSVKVDEDVSSIWYDPSVYMYMD